MTQAEISTPTLAETVSGFDRVAAGSSCALAPAPEPARSGSPVRPVAGDSGFPHNCELEGERNFCADSPPAPGEKGGAGARPIALVCQGLSLPELLNGFNFQLLDRAACRGWLLQKLYPAGPVCPDCGAKVNPGRATDSWWALRRVHCQKCGSWYRATKGTVFKKCNLDIRQIVLLLLAFSYNLNNAAAAALAGVDNKTAKMWRLRYQVGRCQPTVAGPEINAGQDQTTTNQTTTNQTGAN